MEDGEKLKKKKKIEERRMVSRQLQRFEPKRHKCIAMKYSTTVHSQWVVMVGLYAHNKA